MTKIIVFTDLHLLPEGGRIIGLDPYERLLNGLRHVDARHPNAALVVFTGDLTHCGDPESYRRLRTALATLRRPYALMLGNHDYRPAFCEEFPEAPLDPSGFVQQAIDIDRRTRLVLLDTLNGPPKAGVADHAGYLCRRRLAWLEGVLATAGSRRVVLFAHHPPHDTGFPGMDRIRLANAAALHRLIAKSGTVAHIFSGHIHRTIGGSWRGIPVSVFKSPVHQQPMDLDADSSALSVPEPAAYGIVLLRPDGIIVHTEDYELTAGFKPGT